MSFKTTEKIFDSGDAAAFCGMSLDVFRKHVQRGNIKSFEAVGMCKLFLESELKRFIANRRPRGNPAFSRGR